MIRISIACIFFSIIACKPKECFKETGSVQKIKKEIGYFKSIWVEDNISIILIEGDKVFLEAGEKLVNGIDFYLKPDSSLTIKNKNSCSWLRNYDIPIKVYVGANNISYINWRSYGNLESSENLKVKHLQLDIFDVSPKINLSLNAIGLFLYYNSGADITLEGTSSELSISTQGYGKVDASRLIANFVRIKHQGQNNLFVQPIELLDVIIKSSGNVIYTQEPKEKKVNIIGSGKIIKQ